MATLIEVLDMTPTGRYGNGAPIYKFHTSYPNVYTLETAFETKEQAHGDALRWLDLWFEQDPFGNMGCVLGVTVKEGKFHGVVNYYHSNS